MKTKDDIMPKGIAAVTGGTGKVGRKIVQKLLQLGYKVRILTRNKSYRNDSVQVYYGDLQDQEILRLFLENISYLFHCAAELRNENKMWDINVHGTENILNLIPTSSINYFCYLSSAGVVGLSNNEIVDEHSYCRPQNKYEESKLAAERLVSNGISSCSTVILRPTDVIDELQPGALALPIRSNWKDNIFVLLKGGECAHIIHAADVADAAVYFINSRFKGPTIYFVSCDHEQLNTFGGLWSLYKALEHGRPTYGSRPKIHLPIIIPYILRRLWRGSCNYGNVKYSSAKLLAADFSYRLGVEGAVKALVAHKQETNP